MTAQTGPGASRVRAGDFWIVPLDCLGEVHRVVLGQVAKELDKEKGKLGEFLWGKITKATAFGHAEFLFQEAAPQNIRKQSTSAGDGKRANFSIQRMRDELAAEKQKGAHHLPDSVDAEQFVDACRAVAAAVSEITEKCFLDSSSSAPAALVLRKDTKELIMSVRGADVQPCHADGNDEAVFGRLEDFDNVHKRNTSLYRAQPLSILAALGQPFSLLTSPYTNKQETALWKWAKSGGDIVERPTTRRQREIAEFHETLDLPDPKNMTRVVVPAFHAVFFHQGRVHCGDATSDPYNLRFHAYYDHRELKVPKDELVGTFPLSYYEHGVKVEQKYYAKPDLTSSGITRATNTLSQEDAVRAALAPHKI